MPSLTHTITRGDETFVLDVEYEVAPLIPASGPSWDDPGSPEEGGEIESLDVTINGEKFELTAKEIEALEAHIYETHDYSSYDSYEEDTWSSD